MSTLAERQRIADLIEKGNDPAVGYYYSSCVIFGDPQPGQICADPKGYALIGQLGDPITALTKFKELKRSLPDSNPGCVRGAYVLAQLLDADPFLILAIWTRCGHYHDSLTKRDQAVAEFLRDLRRERELGKADFMTEMQAYIEKVGTLQAT